MNTNNETALGTMPVGKLLFQLAVPTIAAQVINALYNMVDRIYIGRLPGGEGPLAIAGLGIAFPIIMIISAFASMIGMGGSPRVSIKMGQQDHDGAEKILGNAVTALIALAVPLTLFFILQKNLCFPCLERQTIYCLMPMTIWASICSAPFLSCFLSA